MSGPAQTSTGTAKTPGPDHPIAIAPATGRILVRFGGEIVAETTRALALREAGYPPVLYIPRDDARMAHFVKTAKITHCPHKGACSYFSLQAAGRCAENAVWSYETPHDAVKAIAGHLAFYPDKVEITVQA